MKLGKKVIREGAILLSKFAKYQSIKRLLNRQVYVVNYHSIIDGDDDPIINNSTYRTPEEFEEDVKFFKSNFNVITPTDIIHNNVIIDVKDNLLLTFDDGLRINYSVHIPILKKYDVKATFFLNSAFLDNKDLHFERKKNLLLHLIRNNPDKSTIIGEYLSEHDLYEGDINLSLKAIGFSNSGHFDELASILSFNFNSYLNQKMPYLNSDEVREILKDGFLIGAHSIDHPRYIELPFKEQVRQTIDSIEFFVQKFNLPYRLFAFPHGDMFLTKEFFKQIRPFVDLTFGTNGFVDDSVDFNIQRSEIETTGLPIKTAMKYRFLTSYLYSVFQQRTISREW